MASNLYGYVINLDRHPERLSLFYQQAELNYFQRVPAIDKKVLELLGDPRYFFNIDFITKYIKREITLGEIGCTLSHIKAWKYISENNALKDDEFAIVAEDDVQLIDKFSSYMSQLLPTFMTMNADLIILQKMGLYSSQPSPFQGKALKIMTPKTHKDCDDDGSALYLIRKSKAKKIVDNLNSNKPNWLADEFSLFCELDKIMLLSHSFGYARSDVESDLDLERYYARQKII